jgi:predicted nucleotidyltransferase
VKNLDEIKTNLSFLKDYEVVVFGSYAGKKADKRSDIDIAVITRENDRNRCMEIWSDILGKAPGVYDIKIFELLPLRIKASVIKKYEVVFGNRSDVSEYFYGFRKLWNDMKHRIEENRFRSMEEKVAALKRGMGSRARMQG